MGYKNNNTQQNTYQHKQNYRTVQRGGYSQRDTGNNLQRNMHRGAIGVRNHSSKDRMRFESDYDFEKANELFEETLNDITKDLKNTKLDCSFP